MSSRAMRASSITGDEVRNREGERLGRVEEIVIDIDTGRVAYAVMAAGGFLGRGDKYFAVPWGLVTIDPETHDVIIDIDKDLLRDAPGLDKGDWPEIDDPTWIGDGHGTYRNEPEWEREVSEPDDVAAHLVPHEESVTTDETTRVDETAP